MMTKFAVPGDVVRLSDAYGRNVSLTHVLCSRETAEVAGLTSCHAVVNVTRKNAAPDEILPNDTAVTCLRCAVFMLSGGLAR